MWGNVTHIREKKAEIKTALSVKGFYVEYFESYNRNSKVRGLFRRIKEEEKGISMLNLKGTKSIRLNAIYFKGFEKDLLKDIFLNLPKEVVKRRMKGIVRLIFKSNILNTEKIYYEVMKELLDKYIVNIRYFSKNKYGKTWGHIDVRAKQYCLKNLWNVVMLDG